MSQFAPQFRFLTYAADEFVVSEGANLGDAMGVSMDMAPGDTYRLSRTARGARLAICDDTSGGQVVADGSDVGHPGEATRIVDCHRLMRSSGELIELLILERTSGTSSSLHVLPLGQMQAGAEYELIDSDPDAAPDRLADIASVRFVAGTHVTRSDGAQVPVEDLVVGDKLLTRSHGAQPIRWIGHQTYRATGPSALVKISEGTLNTARDLYLSPQHRLFIWQRRDALGAGRAEVMVRAELLVNDDTVRRHDGGHVDSYQLVFDGHEIIYAEGIAVESLLVTSLHRARLPDGLALNTDTADGRADLDVDESTLDTTEDVASQLTRASRGHED